LLKAHKAQLKIITHTEGENILTAVSHREHALNMHLASSPSAVSLLHQALVQATTNHNSWFKTQQCNTQQQTLQTL
jgi:hypothetical protein